MMCKWPGSFLWAVGLGQTLRRCMGLRSSEQQVQRN